MTFDIHTREEWNSLPILEPGPPLKHPIKMIFLSYVVTDVKASPILIVNELQKRDLLMGLTDIRPNFLIADDGTCYEGRGWNFQPGNDQNENEGKKGSFMELTFIGDVKGLKNDHPIYKTMTKLMELGIKEKYVSKSAIFICSEDAEDDEGLDGTPVRLLLPEYRKLLTHDEGEEIEFNIPLLPK